MAEPVSGPGLDRERSLAGPVAGVDEVGRGCLAGPVLAAAVIVGDFHPDLAGLRDSKTLSAPRRDALSAAVLARCSVGFGEASVEEIERFDILRATFMAMARAVAALPVRPAHVLVDGNRIPPALPCPATAVVKGDATCLSIAAASVVAKVRRDALMARLHAEHPDYGWDRNAGYGTADHLAGLGRAGPCPHHRRTFAGVKELLQPATLDLFAGLPA